MESLKLFLPQQSHLIIKSSRHLIVPTNLSFPAPNINVLCFLFKFLYFHKIFRIKLNDLYQLNKSFLISRSTWHTILSQRTFARGTAVKWNSLLHYAWLPKALSTKYPSWNSKYIIKIRSTFKPMITILTSPVMSFN